MASLNDGDKGHRVHQVKSRWYYIFWGIATVIVFSGQMFVGVGYRQMADQQHELTEVVQKLLTK
jgi:hypothetical protein